MIVYKQWDECVEIETGGNMAMSHNCDGWFLFGIIPIYIRKRFAA